MFSRPHLWSLWSAGAQPYGVSAQFTGPDLWIIPSCLPALLTAMLYPYHIRAERTYSVPHPPDHSVSLFTLVSSLKFFLCVDHSI